MEHTPATTIFRREVIIRAQGSDGMSGRTCAALAALSSKINSALTRKSVAIILRDLLKVIRHARLRVKGLNHFCHRFNRSERLVRSALHINEDLPVRVRSTSR